MPESNPRVLRAEGAFFWTGCAAYGAYLLYYLGVLTFRDHLEPSVGAMACALARGQPLYGDPAHELPYGPLLFLLHAGMFGALGPSVFALKLPAIVANVGACALTYFALRRGTTMRPAVGGLLLALTFLAACNEYAYWCRPEPFLVLGAAAALFLARSPHPRPYALAFVVAFLVGFKVTGWIYALPALAELRRPRAAIAALVLGIVLSVLLFVAAPISLVAYADVLRKTARHGLSVAMLAENALVAAVLFMPAALAAAARRHLDLPHRSCTVAPLALSVAGMCVLAAKPGAGYHHLLPFVPYAADAVVRQADRMETRLGALGARVSTLGMRAASALAIVALSIAHYENARAAEPRARARSAELSYVLYKYRGEDVGMGYSTGDGYVDTYGKLDVAMAGNPLWLDGSAFMDSQAAGGTALAAAGDALRTCRPPILVVPRGEPFAMTTWYSLPGADRALFDDGFRALFAARYHVVERGQRFDVYRCEPE